MRNLKKILALALVFAMAFTFTAGAADFTDKADIGASYVDDVNMLVELGVIAGYPDGSFGPQKNITRAEFAKMAYTLKYGSDTNGDLFAAQKSSFTDVEGNANVAWAKGYINYCANQKIVSGVGNNKFNPQGNITVAEATKMILVILGCDPAKEGFTGANWAANVTAKAIDLGVFKGWTGDPTALATRELVAKLIRNAVFSPVYTYSAITGMGAQVNYEGNANPLLAASMGVDFLTGIVIANDNYYVTKDAEGDDVNYDGTQVSAGVADEDEAFIYYTYKNEDGQYENQILVVPTALPDEFVGQEVNVFFKGDKTKSNWYENVELIGDIVPTSDNVVYEVNASDITIYPNGLPKKSTSKIIPYIGFTVDGVEKQVKSAFKDRVEKQVDLLTNGSYDTYFDSTVEGSFGSIAYVSEVDADGAGIGFNTTIDANNAFFTEMGKPVMSKYRFVSVDGGKTYSYIFKMVSDTANAYVGTVTNYSEAKGVIAIDTLGGAKALDEVNIEGDVAVDDLVVYYYEDGLLNVVKAETVTGAVEALNDDGSAVIGGKTYHLWEGAAATAEADFADGEKLTDYFINNTSAMGDSTTYYVYNNLVLDLKATEVEAVVEDYAVILRSSYDDQMDIAYVTLAFADNTEATYEIGKFNVENRSKPYDEMNDKASDFADNAYFGMVVKYKVMANGKVDLSANDLGYASRKQAGRVDGKTYDEKLVYSSDRYNNVITGVTADEGMLTVVGGSAEGKYYAANSSSVLFVIYGNPEYNNEGEIVRTSAYVPLKAVAYKLVDKAQQSWDVIPAMYIDGTWYQAGAKAVSFALNATSGINKGIVAAAMTVGTTKGVGVKSETEALAYVASAVRRYNVETGNYFLEMTIIDENGLVSTKTTEEVVNLDANSVDLGDSLGTLDDNEQFAAGTFVGYKLDAEGLISVLDDEKFLAMSDSYTTGAQTGLFKVTVVGERNDALAFINGDETGTVADNEANVNYVAYHEDGCEVITIDDGAYAGERLVKASAKQTLDGGNAVIELHEGEIIRVFCIID